jgi:NAD(P)-dependent dehydrogenase (short-subunit alcohol dehydrogenase family)
LIEEKSMRSISQLSDLTGRSALITGGAGHIGMVGADALMELGANVTLIDKDEDLCQKQCGLLNQKGYKAKAFFVVVDVGDEKALRQSVHQANQMMGGLDIIMHSAAFVGTTQFPGWVVPFEQQTVQAWDVCMRINSTAAFVLIQEALPYLSNTGRGSVILISSIHGMIGPDMGLYSGTKMGNPMAYGVSKAGLIHMARYCATVFGGQFRTNVISPGGVWRNQSPDFHDKYKKRTPLSRMATEEDLKGAIVYLASDMSAYVTGHNLVVDGGYVAW